ncbi:MAG: S10 family peptidase [Candidatus Kryptoniota bacterium]
MRPLTIAVAVAIFLSGCSLYASPQTKNAGVDTSGAPIPKPVQITTHHTITIGGQQIRYTATTGTLLLKDEADKPIALFGFTAYTKEGVSDLSQRPITFAYNGGPGSSSIWLHMGALGPKRVVIDDPGVTPPAPYRIEDNQYSLLDVTDIVMVDPVGTGLSRPIGKAKGSDFWGVDEDIKSVSNFIFQYISTNNRWNSPKFLLGESYGTTRSAGVADYLFEHLGIAVNGVILVSTVLNFETLAFAPGNDLPYILYLPSYAAVAWYHHTLPNRPGDLKTFLNEVRNFAEGEYAQALFKGEQVDSIELGDVLQKLYEYTGISKSYWQKANLRVSEPQFTEELLREKGKVVGRLDSRYEGPSQDPLGEYAGYDPQSTSISPVFVTDFLNYFHNDLNYPTDETYHISAYRTEGFKWNWTRGGRREFGFQNPNVATDLADVLSKNPYLNILILNGYYDLATPFFATEYTVNHLGNNIPDLQKRIHMKYFEAGHMMYIHSESLPHFKSAVAGFIESTIHQKH